MDSYLPEVHELVEDSQRSIDTSVSSPGFDYLDDTYANDGNGVNKDLEWLKETLLNVADEKEQVSSVKFTQAIMQSPVISLII